MTTSTRHRWVTRSHECLQSNRIICMWLVTCCQFLATVVQTVPCHTFLSTTMTMHRTTTTTDDDCHATTTATMTTPTTTTTTTTTITMTTSLPPPAPPCPHVTTTTTTTTWSPRHHHHRQCRRTSMYVGFFCVNRLH